MIKKGFNSFKGSGTEEEWMDMVTKASKLKAWLIDLLSFAF